jgi:hypothetical protein
MKFSLASVLLLAVAGSTAVPTFAQSAAPPPPTQPAPPQSPGGKVIFSRSTDETGQTTTQADPGLRANAKLADAPTADDNERQAVSFTSLDLQVQLRPNDHHIAARALLTVRNDGPKPLVHIPLQISSTLNWERIRLSLPGGQARDVTFPVAVLNSDADHTGQLHEAAVSLTEPLAPGATLQLDTTYSGTIAANAQRLLALGTPDDVALHSDWDQIALDFTGLRGFGNVVWYPVSTVPVILGDGARLFDEIGQHKLRLSGTHFRLRLAVEFPHGRAPSVALINGHPTPLSVSDTGGSDGEIAGSATADSGNQILGFEAPSLFLAIRTAKTAANTNLWLLPDDEFALRSWTDAISAVTPFLETWLGSHPRSPLTLLDLPDAQDAPWETGSLLAAAFRPASQDQLTAVLAHALTHAWIQSPRAWISEGLATFMATLWTEKQHGHEQALGTLESSRTALALAEPASPGESPGQPLDQAISPLYYRTKAAYIFWMLRATLGDPTLSAALRAYDPTSDHIPVNAPISASVPGVNPIQTSSSQASSSQASSSQANPSQPSPGELEKILQQARPGQPGSLQPTSAQSAASRPSASQIGPPQPGSDQSVSGESSSVRSAQTAPLPSSSDQPTPDEPPAEPPASRSNPDLPGITAPSTAPRSLSWFFADWVNADKGLPDLSIASVFPVPEKVGNWLITVNLANNGYASAEVPLTIRSTTNTVTQLVYIPARGVASPHLLSFGKPTEVQLNDGTVPETQATVHITHLDDANPDQHNPNQHNQDQPPAVPATQPQH